MKVNALYAIALTVSLLSFSCRKIEEPTDPVVPVVIGDGPVLSGQVVDTDGNPVPYAVVTDGFTQSETDAEGNFSFTSPYPERVHFVSVRIPSGYDPVVRDGKPVFYCSVPEYDGKERIAEIVLKKKADSGDGFTMLMIADPQSKPYESSTASENFAYASRDVVEDLFAEMRRTIPSVSGPCYGMCLGDITTSSPVTYSQYSLGLSSLEIPFFNVIGNHDHMHVDAETDDDSAAAYEAVFGPRNYSFDIGQFHFVVLDNCIYVKGLRSYPMKYGLEDEFLEWLKGDLARVPKDMPVVICTHANVFNETGVQNWVYDGIQCSYKLDEFLKALQGFDKMYLWAGHSHVGGFVGKVESSANPSGVETFVLARSTGILGGNEYVASDGTPQGFVVLEADGKELSWKFHPVTNASAPFRGAIRPSYLWKPDKIDENMQMRAYPRGAYDDDFVYANIFLWDKSWGMPALTIGGKSYPMTQDCVYDRSYKELVKFYRLRGITASDMGNYATAGKYHHFRVRVPDGVSGLGTVEVTDRFGRKWSAEVSVDPIDYTDGLRHIVFDFRTAPSGCPSTVSKNVAFTCSDGGSDYNLTLSSGCYTGASSDEEGYLLLSGSGSTLTLPALPGYKLVGVTVHPSGNTKTSVSATIGTADGSTISGGDKLVFWGNCADSWTLDGTKEYTSYFVSATSSEFRIGELRLTYTRIDSVGYPGGMEDFVIDDSSDVQFR